jgi:hypothetical protein
MEILRYQLEPRIFNSIQLLPRAKSSKQFYFELYASYVRRHSVRAMRTCCMEILQRMSETDGTLVAS